MILKFEMIKDKLIVHLIGELDHHSAEEVRVKIDDRIDNDNINKLILDFGAVNFMDSSGIGVIVGRYKKLCLKNGVLCVTRIKGNIEKVFELSGLFKIIDRYEDVNEAIKSI